MCDASKKEKAIGAKINNFSDQMVSQATDVFGKDNSVFNTMKDSYDKTVANGPNQHGFNQDELNSRRAAAITNTANQYRNIAGAVKSGQAGFGGGNNLTDAGVTTGADLSVAEAAANQTASELGNIDAADYETGRRNYEFAAQEEGRLPGVFDNMASLDAAASKGLDQSLQEQKSLDAAAGWWKKPVMGLAMGGISALTGGLGSLATGGTFMKGFGTALGGVGKAAGAAAPAPSGGGASDGGDSGGLF